jgi:hypothetical protein
MPAIQTLVKDIYKVVGSETGWFNGAIAKDFSRELGLTLLETTKPREEVPRLRLSQMGKKCPSALWHSIHSPMDAEPFPPWVLIKFTYGHILEALLISMAKAAGHEVTGEQDELILDGVTGHRDCVIDGCTVDVKSLNSNSFQTLKAGLAPTDPFLRDYLDQLDGYAVAAHEDPLVRVKDKGYILAIDKTLGHLHLYEHAIRSDSIRERIKHHREIVGRDRPPTCTCQTVTDGKSGNIKLDLKASYNPFKYSCFPHLRTFLYARGPVYLTKTVRRPDVTEIDKHGKIIYN